MVLFLTFLFNQTHVEARTQKKEIATPLKSLYSTLDPLSVTEHLAFYELYPDTKEGQHALKRAWQLLSSGEIALEEKSYPSSLRHPTIISLITRQQSEAKSN